MAATRSYFATIFLNEAWQTLTPKLISQGACMNAVNAWAALTYPNDTEAQQSAIHRVVINPSEDPVDENGVPATPNPSSVPDGLINPDAHPEAYEAAKAYSRDPATIPPVGMPPKLQTPAERIPDPAPATAAGATADPKAPRP